MMQIYLQPGVTFMIDLLHPGCDTVGIYCDTCMCLPGWVTIRQIVHDRSRRKAFLLHDVMHKRGICRHEVSVCLFVTFVDSVETYNLSSKFFNHWIATLL